jgi:hypothetical protein
MVSKLVKFRLHLGVCFSHMVAKERMEEMPWEMRRHDRAAWRSFERERERVCSRAERESSP